MNWGQLPLRLKIYIATLSIVAVPITLFAIWDLSVHSYAHYNGNLWLVLTLLTVLTVPFYLLLPSVSTIVGIGDAYVMSVAMLCGPSPCIAATLCHTFAGSIFVPNRPRIYAYRVVFNISNTICCAWIYSNIYYFLNPSLSKQISDILFPIVPLTVTFFIFNSLSTATAISLASGQKIFKFWSQNYLSLGVEFSISALSATTIVALYPIWEYAPLAAAPLIGVVYCWHKLNSAKAIEAEHHLKEQEALYLRTVESLALAVEAKDQTTYGHIRRVRAYALGLAKLCDICDKSELMAIETSSLLHDIGKLAIDDFILNKPGRLSKQEFEKMKLHSSAGDEILQQVQFPFPVARYVRSHHERWDGSGYPDGLRGEEIPFGARILAIADAFDAIRSSRPYKLAFSIPESLDLLRAQAGKIYDPSLVEKFIANIDELNVAAEHATKNVPELSFRKYFEQMNQSLSTNTDPSPSSILPNAGSPELIHLIEFCDSFGRKLELEDSLLILSRRLQRIFPCVTSIFFLDHGDGVLEAEHVSGLFSDSLKNVKIGLGKGISGWAAAYKQPVIKTMPSLDFQIPSGDFSLLSDALVAPIINDGICIGTISLYAGSPHTFSQAQLELLVTIANHVAPLIADNYNRGTSAEDLDLIDPTTLTYRVAYLSVIGSQMIELAAQNKTPLSMLFLDIKSYGHITGLYGAKVGDLILRKIADHLRNELRETDVIARYGHQGFVALIPGVRHEQASRFAMRLQQLIKSTAINQGPGHGIYVYCQTAVSSYPDDGVTISELLDSAQRSLAQQPGAIPVTDKNVIEFPPRSS